MLKYIVNWIYCNIVIVKSVVIYIHACMCIYGCARLCLSICVCACVCVWCICVCMCVCEYVCMCAHVCMSVHKHKHAHPYIHIHALINTYTQSYTHILIHTYIYMIPNIIYHNKQISRTFIVLVKFIRSRPEHTWTNINTNRQALHLSINDELSCHRVSVTPGYGIVYDIAYLEISRYAIMPRNNLVFMATYIRSAHKLNSQITIRWSWIETSYITYHVTLLPLYTVESGLLRYIEYTVQWTCNGVPRTLCIVQCIVYSVQYTLSSI